MRGARRSSFLGVLAFLAGFGVLAGADAAGEGRSEERAPCAAHDENRQAFFGDTHVHTGLSFDSWGQGTLAGPREAYRFARGEEIGLQPYDEKGVARAHMRLPRPLDFAVATDHSDLFGELRICQTPSLEGYDSIVCRVVRRFPALGYILVNGHVYSNPDPHRYSFCGEAGRRCLEAGNPVWQEIQAAAEAYYDRSAACSFTTFVGYEWTSMPGGNNIHRNVVFRGTVVQDYPTTYIETPEADGLWRALLGECIEGKPGCDAIAIPHNSNVSGGLMWTTTRGDGSPITSEDARTRARLETLVEVIQHKGDSECRASAEDELCSFEKVPIVRLQDLSRPVEDPQIPPRVYAREALAEGLVQQARLGVNPFRFGLIGSTDTHLSAAGRVEEDRHLGHGAGNVSARFGPPPYPDVPFFNPGGLAVLWAEENSRDALFAAMKRREAYGTSGPRIAVRFFGGWEHASDLCEQPDFAARGYQGGVPMGGELPPRPATATAPRFPVWALRDAGSDGVPGTALQRIQIVKGWLEDGVARERVFEVAGDAQSPADVDLATCEPRGRGFDSLCSVWSDPDFRSDQAAFYYARVVENPSCRWNTWVCNRQAVDCTQPGSVPRELRACCDADVPKTIQERAWTSPIWYTPSAD